MKKIMFNDFYGLTQAVLEGRKTMTRRLIKGDYERINAFPTQHGVYFKGETKDGDYIEVQPQYWKGEIVAVAQSYHELNKAGYVAPEWFEHTCESSAGYNNKMFVRADLMPNRIKITNIKVERLQDISHEDCLKEYIYKWPDRSTWTYGNCWYVFPTPQKAFAELIDKVSGRGTWESNPYVFVYEFELLKGGAK